MKRAGVFTLTDINATKRLRWFGYFSRMPGIDSPAIYSIGSLSMEKIQRKNPKMMYSLKTQKKN